MAASLRPSEPGTSPEAPEALASGVPLRVWVFLGLGIAVIGGSAILIRLAGVEDAVDFRALVFWRLMFTVAVLLPLGFQARARGQIVAMRGRDAGFVVAAGALLGLHFLGWFASLAFTSVASATVLVTMSPLFIAVLGFAFLRERLSVRAWSAIFVGVAGAVLIGLADARGGTFPHAALGNALAFGAAFCFAVYLLVGRVVRQRLDFAALCAA